MPRTLFSEDYVRMMRAVEGENGSVSAVHQLKSQINIGKDCAGFKRSAGYLQNRVASA
jgi:hypothetical protein